MSNSLQAVIIGAGFGGLMMGLQLRKHGIEDFLILEGAEDVGGSWRTNTYPGCACDVPSHLYSYSFEPNPTWSRAFSAQGEIKTYIETLAEKHGLRRFIRFNTPVTQAIYDQDSGSWTVDTDTGDTLVTKVLLQCTGGLSLPKFPEVPGRDAFKGEQLHTAQWRDIDLSGKRVAIVGTGASAVQVIPAIADEVSELYVIQNSPAWVVPKHDKAYTDKERRGWRDSPWTQILERRIWYWIMEMSVPALLWFPSLLKFGENEHKKALASVVSDPVLRAQLTPNYQLGCKRTLISDDYFATFTKPNVTLVAEGLQSLTERGLTTATHTLDDIDLIIYATGFETGAPAFPFQVVGSNGQDLRDYWDGVPRAFYGMTVSHYPNFGMIMGPNSGPGHTSVLIYQEAQAKYLARYTAHLVKQRLHALDLRASRLDQFFQRMQRRMRRSTWASGCSSWYQNADGTNSTMWPGFSFEFILAVKRLHLSAYNQHVHQPKTDYALEAPP